MKQCRPWHLVALTLLVVMSQVDAAASQTRQTASNGTVVVVHGLEGFLADVYLDGSSTPALQGFEYRRVTDPLMLPAGTHRADLRQAGDPPSATPALSGSFTVTPDQTITVAALLSADGEPSWIAFANDAPPVEAGASLVRFRHFAAAGPVTFVLDGQQVLESIPNVTEDANVLPVKTTPGAHRVEVVDSNTGQVLVPAQSLQLTDQSADALYLTGKSETGTLGLLQQRTGVSPAAVQVLGTQVTPTQIAGGNSGLADRSENSLEWPLIAVAVALLVVALTTVSRRRA
jgi:hypothetical protein